MATGSFLILSRAKRESKDARTMSDLSVLRSETVMRQVTPSGSVASPWG